MVKREKFFDSAAVSKQQQRDERGGREHTEKEKFHLIFDLETRWEHNIFCMQFWGAEKFFICVVQ